MSTELSEAAARVILADASVSIIDARPAPEFSRGHPADALCVPYSDRGFATRIRVAEPDVRSVVLVLSLDGERAGASRQLEESGIGLLGSAPADPDWWSGAGVDWQQLPERSIDGLAGSTDSVVVDVREPMEWETGHVPGAILVSLGELYSRPQSIPRDREVVLICETGIRSATGASILLKAGYVDVAHAPEGTASIRQQGGPLEYPHATASERA